MPSDFSSEFTSSSNPSVKIVTLRGELDESVLESFKEELVKIMENMELKSLVFNLRDLDFINSKGIGFIVWVHSHLTKDGRHLILADAKEAVMDVMNLVGLTTIIPYYVTLDEAVSAL